MPENPQILVLGESLTGEDLRAMAQYLPPEFRLQPITVAKLTQRLVAEKKAISAEQKLAQWAVNGLLLPSNGISAELSAALQQSEADLPVLAEQALSVAQSCQQFIDAVSARAEFTALCVEGCSAHALIGFHSRYKYLLLSHSQPLYRQLGPLVADMASWPSTADFALMYRHKLMEILRCPPTRENHTNVLMHIQGYFRPHLSGEQRQALAATIDQYRRGELSLRVPVAKLKACLADYPHEWIASQRYLFPYLASEAEKLSPEVA